MKNFSTVIKTKYMRPGIFKILLLCLPVMLITLLMLSRGKLPAGGSKLFAFIATYLFINGSFFLMIRTGKTDCWRSMLFTIYAVGFAISFITNIIEMRGSMAVSRADMIEGLSPFCHIVIPMTLIPAALTQTIIYPGTIVGSYASIASMFVLWIGSSLALGRGFCSWICFFGGLDDGFSRLFAKAKIKNINPGWTYLPYAILLAIILGAALTLSPVYCSWLCPFKTITEYPAITSVKTAIQTVIFVFLFVGLVIVLPALVVFAGLKYSRRTASVLFRWKMFTSFRQKISIRLL